MESPITSLMQEYGAPLTRDEFVKWSNLGKNTKVSPEEEAELPKRFAYPVVEHSELPEVKEKPKAAKPKAGAEPPKPPKDVVKHFNGKVFKSPAPEETPRF